MKNALEKVDQGLKGKLPWTLGSIDKLPGDEGGVYAVWYRPTGKCVYVGQTGRDLRRRLMEHWEGGTSPDLAGWISEFGEALDLCYRRSDPERAKRLEKRLIRKWQPEANKRGK